MSEIVNTRIAQGGRIVIPASIRRRAGLEIGENVRLTVGKDGSVRILSQREGIRKAQELVKKHLKGKGSLVEELVRERRREAANE